jgi:serine/threonine-protein kinase HipA
VTDGQPPWLDLVRLDRGDVYKAGVLVAQLVRHEDRVEFRYLHDHVDGRDVATTLPAGPAVVVTPGRSVPPYFAGLLPEGRRLTALRSALKTSADDDFSMLLAVGGDPVGDVQVVPAGVPPPPLDDDAETVSTLGAAAIEAASFASVSFAEVFGRLLGGAPDPVGFAGVQDKVSGRMISVPLRVGGTSYLLKLDPPEFPHLVENEQFFLSVARSCGLPVVESHVVRDREGLPGLVVERFDRHRAGGVLVSSAVEDGCQVAGRYPGDKYALDTEALFSAMARHCAARPVALRDLFRQLVVAIVTGNGDLHAKNVSIIDIEGEWRVAPTYDVPSSAPYGDRTLALALGGTREGQVSRRRLLESALAMGLPERAATITLDDLLSRLRPVPEQLEQLPFDDRRIADLRRLMRARMQLLRP